MVRFADLFQVVANFPVDQSSGLNTLFGYLRQTRDDQEILTTETLNQALKDLLVYPHWQQRFASLRNELLHFLSRAQFDQIETAGLLQADTWQVVEVNSHQNQADLLQSFMTSHCQMLGAEFRLIPLPRQEWVSVVLHPDQTLTLWQFDHRFIFEQGLLVPLKSDRQIHYSAELELEPHLNHKLEIGAHHLAWLTTDGSTFEARSFRGYLFQPRYQSSAPTLSQFPDLELTLLKLETLFLDPGSNPHRVQLCQKLERLIELLRTQQLSGTPELMQFQLQTQDLIETVFPGDKVLALLLKEFSLYLHESMTRKESVTSRSSRPQEPTPWNQTQSPKRLNIEFV